MVMCRMAGGVIVRNQHRRFDRMSRMLRAKHSADVTGERRANDDEGDGER
jgi:hypothetical protein